MVECEFENKVAVVTGGAKGIGKCICEEFEKQGAKVCIIDLLDNPYFTGDLADIANMVLYLCSDKAGFITGENICIDGGMTRQMIYHNDFGWKLEK